MGEFEMFQIAISKNYTRESWFEDLRALFRKAGQSNLRVVFLLVDTQIVMEAMLEDVNNILNTQYVEAGYVQMPGRWFKVGLNYAFTKTSQ